MPPRLKGLVRALRTGTWPPLGWVRFGDLRRLSPISSNFGLDRGLPVDRYYIEAFLKRHADDVRGQVLEFEKDKYAHLIGGKRVTSLDIMHLTADNPCATIVADLAKADAVPSARFDCIICTQTLQYIYDVRAAISHLHRILKPGGVVLATVPGICKRIQYARDGYGEHWRFTSLSLGRSFGEVFEEGHIEVAAYGNVAAAIAFLHGLSAEELTIQEKNFYDPGYEVVVAVRARKREDPREGVR